MVNEPFEPLTAFFGWFMGHWKGGLFPSVHDGITRIGDYPGLILYRQPPFQVELWILPPNTESPEHLHPNVDIYLVAVTGELKVWVGEELLLGPVHAGPDKNGVSKANGRYVRLPPGQLHRAGTGPLGGAFMNIQHWLDGKPRSTDTDWHGVALNDDHKKKLLHQSVLSPQKNCGDSMMEPDAISRKAPDTEPSLAGSIQSSLIARGIPSYEAAGVNCGPATIKEK